MKTKLLAILLMLIVALPLSAAPPYKSRNVRPQSAIIDNGTYINANKILMFVTNHGNFARDLSGVFGHDAGTFYPYNTIEDIESGLQDKYCLYASGLWIGGQVAGETRVIIAEYSDEYVPGPMIRSQAGVALVDRNGGIENLPIPMGIFTSPRISKDGRHILLAQAGELGLHQFLVYDVERGASVSLNDGNEHEYWGIWDSTGENVIYNSSVNGKLPALLFRKNRELGIRIHRFANPAGRI